MLECNENFKEVMNIDVWVEIELCLLVFVFVYEVFFIEFVFIEKSKGVVLFGLRLSLFLVLSCLFVICNGMFLLVVVK